jgi:hypothetical protein
VPPQTGISSVDPAAQCGSVKRDLFPLACAAVALVAMISWPGRVSSRTDLPGGI